MSSRLAAQLRAVAPSVWEAFTSTCCLSRERAACLSPLFAASTNRRSAAVPAVAARRDSQIPKPFAEIFIFLSPFRKSTKYLHYGAAEPRSAHHRCGLGSPSFLPPLRQVCLKIRYPEGQVV